MNKWQKEYAIFRNEFDRICIQFSGEKNTAYAIGDNGSAWEFATSWGVLRASVCQLYRPKDAIACIPMRWADYFGPVPFPLLGDFNRSSHKWNIIFTGGNIDEARGGALAELSHRLRIVRDRTTPTQTAYRFLHRPPYEPGNSLAPWTPELGLTAIHTPATAQGLVDQWSRQDQGKRIWRAELVCRGSIDDPATA